MARRFGSLDWVGNRVRLTAARKTWSNAGGRRRGERLLGFPRDPGSPLIGRGSELSELLLTLARGTKGEGSLATLEGEAGIGKTFLLEDVLEKARSLGFRCFAGAAEELERHRPFGAISEALGIGRRGRIDEAPLPGDDKRRAAVAQLLAEPA